MVEDDRKIPSFVLDNLDLGGDSSEKDDNELEPYFDAATDGEERQKAPELKYTVRPQAKGLWHRMGEFFGNIGRKERGIVFDDSVERKSPSIHTIEIETSISPTEVRNLSTTANGIKDKVIAETSRLNWSQNETGVSKKVRRLKQILGELQRFASLLENTIADGTLSTTEQRHLFRDFQRFQSLGRELQPLGISTHQFQDELNAFQAKADLWGTYENTLGELSSKQWRFIYGLASGARFSGALGALGGVDAGIRFNIGAGILMIGTATIPLEYILRKWGRTGAANAMGHVNAWAGAAYTRGLGGGFALEAGAERVWDSGLLQGVASEFFSTPTDGVLSTDQSPQPSPIETPSPLATQDASTGFPGKVVSEFSSPLDAPASDAMAPPVPPSAESSNAYLPGVAGDHAPSEPVGNFSPVQGPEPQQAAVADEGFWNKPTWRPEVHPIDAAHERMASGMKADQSPDIHLPSVQNNSHGPIVHDNGSVDLDPGAVDRGLLPDQFVVPTSQAPSLSVEAIDHSPVSSADVAAMQPDRSAADSASAARTPGKYDGFTIRDDGRIVDDNVWPKNTPRPVDAPASTLAPGEHPEMPESMKQAIADTAQGIQHWLSENSPFQTNEQHALAKVVGEFAPAVASQQGINLSDDFLSLSQQGPVALEQAIAQSPQVIADACTVVAGICEQINSGEMIHTPEQAEALVPAVRAIQGLTIDPLVPESVMKGIEKFVFDNTGWTAQQWVQSLADGINRLEPAARAINNTTATTGH